MNAEANDDNMIIESIIEKAPADNMEIWGEAYKTPPEFTKEYQGAGGFKGKAISSLYPVMKATELFGPVGMGWGYDIVTDEMITGGPLVDKEGNSLGCNETTHSMRVELWAKRDGQIMKAVGIGLTPFITKNKWGVTTDHEAQKKSLTDAIKGGLKMWGISADVYMGQHDDQSYVEHVRNISEMDKADDKAAEAIKQTREYEEWKDKTSKLIDSAVSLNELIQVHKAAVLKATRNNDSKYVDKITKACAKRKSELQPEQAA